MKRICVLLSCLCVGLGACAQQEKSVEKELRLNIQAEPMSLNPGMGGDRRSQVVVNLLFEGLLRKGPEGLHPGIAESVEQDGGGLRYVFHLRPSKWSDGSDLTAEDFVRSWKDVVRRDSKSFFAYAFYPIKNARKIKLGEAELDSLGVQALDANTLEVELEHSAPYFLELCANPVYAPSPSGQTEVFNGPFVLDFWQKGASFKLSKNPNYWDSASVQLDSVRLHVIPDAHTNLASFEMGEVDFAGEPLAELPHTALESLGDEGILHQHPIAGVFWYDLNHRKFPLNHVKVRQALSGAIDREEIVAHVLLGQGQPCESLLPPSLQLVHGKKVQPDEARRMLREAMEELGLSEFPVLTLSYGDVEGHKALAQAVQAQWRKNLGIEVQLQGLEWNVFLQNIFQKNYEIGGVNWFSWFDDPIYNLQAFKDPEDRMNACAWEDATYVNLLEKSDRELDVEKRKQLLAQAESRFLQAAPLVPVYAMSYKYVQSPRLKGVYLSNLGLVEFKWASLDSKD